MKILLILLATSVLIVSSRFFNVPNKKSKMRRFERADGNCINNFCNETTGYPAKHLRQLVAKNKKFSPLFGKVVSSFDEFNVQSRFFIAEKENLCPSRVITMYPQRAKNVRDVWQTIVNVDGHLQGITFETCAPKGSCFQTNGLISGYITSCEQQYIVVRLVILNGKGEMSLEHFPIPSGCACVYSMKQTDY